MKSVIAKSESYGTFYGGHIKHGKEEKSHVANNHVLNFTHSVDKSWVKLVRYVTERLLDAFMNG